MKDKGLITNLRDEQRTSQVMDAVVKKYKKAPLKKNLAFESRRRKSMRGLSMTPNNKLYDIFS